MMYSAILFSGIDYARDLESYRVYPMLTSYPYVDISPST